MECANTWTIDGNCTSSIVAGLGFFGMDSYIVGYLACKEDDTMGIFFVTYNKH